ncbi:hypothetical protein B0T14DRAFT_573521 [Immersiella caudata]|uniref:Uncharacterized protein n=1 Tax=Immersiella caudata TaxID=314043 RepID=A0AA39XDT2_9PEZI|nr:hypothetical protein B0T14DRAFT_573521 [Immersiella caudata]
MSPFCAWGIWSFCKVPTELYIALALGPLHHPLNTTNIPQAKHNPHNRQARSLKHIYRSKYHQRMHSLPAALASSPTNALPSGGFLSPKTTITPPTSTLISVNATTVTAVDKHRGGPPGSFFRNGTGWGHGGRGGHGHGYGHGHVPGAVAAETSSCSTFVKTFTETVNITVIVTTSMGAQVITRPNNNQPTVSPSSIFVSPAPARTVTVTSPPRTNRITLSSVRTPRPSPSPSPSSIDAQPSPSQTNTKLNPSSANTDYPPSPTDCVIDPFLTPNMTVAASIRPSAVQTQEITPAATVCAKSAPSGKPNAANLHCGVRGKAGDYFLGRYTQNGNGIDVTLKGCWQFCGKSV